MRQRLTRAASLFWVAALLAAPAVADLSPVERDIAAAVDAEARAHVELLERIVNINSGTMNADGVKEVGSVLSGVFERHGLQTHWVDLPPSADRAGHLVANATPQNGKDVPNILLIGHLDTVFELDSPFQRFEYLPGNRARGPGVTDMKGGNVVIVAAVAALAHAGALGDVNLTIVMTGDEERPGRPIQVSRKALLDAGRNADYILGLENNINLTSATVARRGSSGWKLEVKGVRGHSSQVFSDRLGAGAIFEASRILDAFYGQVRGERYLTFNPGVILGGTAVEYDARNSRGDAFGKTNVVAQDVVVRGGLRFITEDQKKRARERMRQIVRTNLPQTEATITFTDGYPAMPPSEGNLALFEQLSAVSVDLGEGPLSQVDPGRRGAADISFVGRLAPSLAGLGPVGSNLHAEGETVDLASIPLVTKRVAILMHRLSQP